ncbi:hypothetical protein [Geodermatophilus sp. SYSU D00742]
MLMAVDDPDPVRPVEEDLRKRYGTDYDVRCPTSPEEALRDLGDVRHGAVKRVASAVGEGAVAIRMVHDHLSPG